MQCRFKFDDRPAPALSILQPWAWAIAEGAKRVENRTWKTNYRGPLWIQAAKSLRSLATATPFIEARGLMIPDDLPTGVIVARVELVDCVPLAQCDDPWAQGPWCWVLDNVERLAEPVPCRGLQQLFKLTADVEAEAVSQLVG